ncbi:Uncharacterized protein TPAR_02777 [Tolypocladium paradoxum]|uniref:Heat shock factor-binding protein 1 n=1 Tax=Tolypocladium paradoxum TaxID=94208 RepID=A0A2S4L3K0_9HYPO|nr:Uncharacterized protein TPAR_02777 [Tolypocladium paradoxum]
MASNEPEPSTADEATSPETTNADVTAAVEELLNSLSNKFAGVSSEIFAKTVVAAKQMLTRNVVDEMSRRLDNLEAALLESKAKDGGPPKPQ